MKVKVECSLAVIAIGRRTYDGFAVSLTNEGAVPAQVQAVRFAIEGTDMVLSGGRSLEGIFIGLVLPPGETEKFTYRTDTLIPHLIDSIDAKSCQLRPQVRVDGVWFEANALVSVDLDE